MNQQRSNLAPFGGCQLRNRPPADSGSEPPGQPQPNKQALEPEHVTSSAQHSTAQHVLQAHTGRPSAATQPSIYPPEDSDVAQVVEQGAVRQHCRLESKAGPGRCPLKPPTCRQGCQPCGQAGAAGQGQHNALCCLLMLPFICPGPLTRPLASLHGWFLMVTCLALYAGRAPSASEQRRQLSPGRPERAPQC